MKEQYLRITADQNHEFFKLYDTLSALRKKIWRKIAAKFRAWTIVQPNQTTIGKWCGCSRSAVSEALRLFRKWGWIRLVSRGWKRSKRLVISENKECIDVANRQWFRRVEATYKATHTYSTFSKKKGRKNLIEPLRVAPRLESRDLTLEQKLKLSLIPEDLHRTAYEICLNKKAEGFEPADPKNYVIGTALNLARESGIKLNWRGYYAALGR